MLRPLTHPVACCCVLLGVLAQSLKPVNETTCKRTKHLPTLLDQQSWELLRPFPRSLIANIYGQSSKTASKAYYDTFVNRLESHLVEMLNKAIIMIIILLLCELDQSNK